MHHLYARMEASLFASWAALAGTSQRAALRHAPGVTAAVFPELPESAFFNNAVLARGLGSDAAAEALASAEQIYAEAGVDRYAIWALAAESAAIDVLDASDLEVAETTTAMAMSLEDAPVDTPEFDIRVGSWQEYVALLDREGVPAGLMKDAGTAGYHVRLAYVDGELGGGSLARDHSRDCGIFNVGTFPDYRRRGIGTALTVVQLQDARERGCETASLQATPMAERLYASVGFRDLGRFVEYAPRTEGLLIAS